MNLEVVYLTPLL